jgi:hypothetical protein
MLCMPYDKRGVPWALSLVMLQGIMRLPAPLPVASSSLGMVPNGGSTSRRLESLTAALAEEPLCSSHYPQSKPDEPAYPHC